MEGLADLRQAIRLDDIRYDPWGTSIAWHFAVARVLHAMGEAVPAKWEFRRAMGDTATVGDIAGDEDDEGLEYPDADVALMVQVGIVDAETLRHWGNVLDRYNTLCRHYGRNY
jgi:hypothetical protein